MAKRAQQLPTGYLRQPTCYGETELPEGWYPRNLPILSDPWHRASLAAGAGTSALAATGLDAAGAAMSFAWVLTPRG